MRNKHFDSIAPSQGKEWIRFYNKHTGKEYSRISIDGLFLDEIEETKKLISFEQSIPYYDIEIELI